MWPKGAREALTDSQGGGFRQATNARKVMSKSRLIKDYAWLLPAYATDVGGRPGPFKRTDPHEGVSGTLAQRRLHWRSMGVGCWSSSTTERR